MRHCRPNADDLLFSTCLKREAYNVGCMLALNFFLLLNPKSSTMMVLAGQPSREAFISH